MNYARSLTEAETPNEMLKLLTRYLQLALAMISPNLQRTHYRQLYGIQVSTSIIYSWTPNQSELPA